MECEQVKQDKSGLLCYAKPKEPGWYVEAGIARPRCPEGFRNDPLTCWKPESYGRGGGYPWKFGDGLNLDGARSRCAKDNPQGCEQSGQIIYPKCKENFHAVGCCVCSPDCPKGMTDGGAHCNKPSYVLPPITPNCGAKEYDAGLCYDKCNTGFYGVGPVCWGQCPAGKTDCGAMCGDSAMDCLTAIGEMVYAVGDVALKVAKAVGTLGASIGTDAAAQAARTAALEALKKTAKETAKTVIKKLGTQAVNQIKPAIAKELLKLGMPDFIANKLAEMTAEPDKFDYLGFIASVDVTGLTNAVLSFKKEICKAKQLDFFSRKTSSIILEVFLFLHRLEQFYFYIYLYIMNLITLKDKQNTTLRHISLKDINTRHNFWVELQYEQSGIVQTCDEIEVHTHETHDKVQDFLRMHRGLWLVALNNKHEIIGEVDIIIKNLARIKHVGVLTIGILKAYQSLGLGSALLTHALLWAKTQGLKRVELSVFASNKKALGLYKKHGFVIEGQRKNYLYHGDEIYEDDFLMATYF